MLNSRSLLHVPASGQGSGLNDERRPTAYTLHSSISAHSSVNPHGAWIVGAVMGFVSAATGTFVFNPLFPFIWFRVAVPREHPELRVEEY